MKRLKIFPTLIIFCSTLLFSDTSFTTMRGVQVTDKQGDSLYLYNDYYALVVGVPWPDPR